MPAPDNSVIGVTPAVVGSVEASETLKLICGYGEVWPETMDCRFKNHAIVRPFTVNTSENMKLITITQPAFFEGEAEAITSLFDAGLEILHLRNPAVLMKTWNNY